MVGDDDSSRSEDPMVPLTDTSERHQRLRAIFETALQHDASVREGYLDQACAGDAELRRHVMRLLVAQPAATSFLERPAEWHASPDVGFSVREDEDPAGEDPPLAAGTMVGRYRIEGLLARGGMGAVYRAADLELGRDVALKVMARTGSDDVARVERFMQEARVTASLNHPNIVRAYDVGIWASRPYLITELLDGETLRARLTRGVIPPEDARRIARDVSRGLVAAHAAGLVHRDLKPENIFLTRTSVSKILDFGIAKLAQDDARRAAPSTLSGVLFGTVGYLAPEQICDAPVDGRADLFALGSILFEMLAGHGAFAREHTIETLYAVLHEPTPDVLRLRDDVPPALTAIVTRLLEKAPEGRFQTATDLESALEQIPSAGASIVPVPPPWGRWALAVGAVAVAAVGAAVALVSRIGTPTLTDRDTVLVADFVNTTGEGVFDGSLRQALTIELEQSPFLSIVPRERVTHTLTLMTRSPDEPVVDALAREACQRLGATLTINGSLAAIGTHYLVALEAVNCHSGDHVVSEKAESADRDHILKALDTTSARLRRRLGESRRTLQRFTTPIEEATTSSLEALNAFHLGNETRARVGDAAALPFFTRAIDLDPDFARAYAVAASIYGNEGRYDEETRFTEEAYARRNRVSEPERLFFDARHCYVSNEPPACIASYELWRRTYPRDPIAAIYICNAYRSLGRIDEAVASCLESVRLLPDHAIPYGNLIDLYIGLGRLAEAKAIAEQALARKLEAPSLHLHLFKIALALEDQSTLAAQQQWAVGKPAEGDFVALEAERLASVGRLTESHAANARAESMVAALKQDVDAVRARGAFIDAVLGDEPRARAILARMSDRRRSRATVDAALAAVLAHDRGRAERLLRLPRHGLEPYDRAMLDTTGALLDIDAGNRAAIDRIPPLTGGEFIPEAALRPIYVRGLAYLRAGAAGQAVDEFQRILDHPGSAPESPLHALAHVQQARAYVLAGNAAKAGKAYEDFLALWTNADRDVPILKQAQAEHAEVLK